MSGLPPPTPLQRARPSSWSAGAVWVFAHDLLWAGAAMAMVLAAENAGPGTTHRVLLSFLVVCAVVFPLLRLQKGLWRFTALNDLFRVAGAVLVADVALVALLFFQNRLAGFSRLAAFGVVPILIVGLSLGRIVRQIWSHRTLEAVFRFEDRSMPAVVVVGSMKAASAYLKAERRSGTRERRIAGIVALDPSPPFGRTVKGAEVLGDLNRLAPILKALRAAEERAAEAILVEPRPGRALMEAVVAAAAEAGALVTTLDAGGSSPQTHPISPADLLDRPPRSLSATGPRALIADKRVVVTGAGGTIGSEIARQVLALQPEKLVLFDASEFNLYAIDQALRAEGVKSPWTAELGDVRDLRRLETLFAAERPHVVFHAAALKHVPLMELNPCETVLTNVIGAANVARAARDISEALVFISTDKAVKPTNVMGATKRVAEHVVQALARDHPMRASAVRFGNVLGSSGSVAPLFERQIAAGGPVTVTDPQTVRYFMTVNEAAALVLQAASLPRDGDGADDGQVYVLDMGEPVRIDDLARQMIRLHGLEPGRDIEIAYTGLRPGEKLSEELFYDAETVRPTAADGVLSAVDATPTWAALEGRIEALAAAATARDEAQVLALLAELEPAFRRG